ncbi:bifunctional diaminohydroxyphosphoribosylaminopyrimidine deaminase/5-amino-6-(5-phosphoribosylamino)uracil reductase RibD [Campylobacter sp. RM13119]|uniref:bifunctional diaminohydroxyphosphoribosylaminopyrimidine deaminase/5-amino-6-(5-phosphoribosylamino)uracil reductase RibD n=1 Tax=Campylobacter californiensis TaxID=1032243 RepID=UPI0014746A16|nr:bifunctional diaminohydroxyphosphoribosylaminopyrimidine deaminase/5-amino-6-(5-phosphoribosylamino)uracil reductase RibD [Campylobacter sp. RM13119]MBE3606205.1 bifunctional diaminohydroxyphosphoribosylaminopyrimidine deaminase/5-amino-6-(5-phosphoribosylamino)uracil reductase RibD [Campylobacter sp. RM13119]
MSDEFYMNLALNEAWKYQILTYPNPAVGCVVLDKSGKILSIGAHKKAGFLHAEPSAILLALCEISDDFLHKFILNYDQKFNTNFLDISDKHELLEKLKEVYLNAVFTYDFIMQNHGDLLDGAKAYVTLEPCSHYGKTPPCANLFVQLKFAEVVISCEDKNKIASGGISILQNAGIKVKVGVLKQDGGMLLKPFLSWQEGNFSFLKVALSVNGAATGGVISNETSRAHMHSIRSIVDLLVIGGNTVRIDRPKLDARLVKNGKSPNVLIFSREQKFDESLPLFHVKEREVEISNSLLRAKKSPLVMYEGAQEFLNLAKNGALPNVKWLLLYQSSNFKNEPNLLSQIYLKSVFRSNFADDSYGWYEIV